MPANADPLTKGAQTRQVILRAAVDRFGRDGYRAASVADIARAASVGGTVAYAYFPSKEALFLAAVDEDVAALIEEGVSTAIIAADVTNWPEKVVRSLLGRLDHHPLARRLLAGLEPEVTERVLDIPALNELRKAAAELLRAQQAQGSVRADIDTAVTASGIVTIMLSLLMSVVQIGANVADRYGDDIAAVLGAALTSPTR